MLEKTIKNDPNIITVQEILYYLFLLALMGGKAVGLTEGQRPFYALMVFGAACMFIKLLITEYAVYEWIINLLLVCLGAVIYYHTGYFAAIFGILMVIGMKNVPLERAVKAGLSIWGVCFVFSVIRALLGGYQGYIGVQQKVGMDAAYIRYSLGYTHPNVLHITYLIIVLMLLYLLQESKKNIWIISILLLIGNAYVYLYSLSYTGFITVVFCILINLYLYVRKNISKIEKILIIVFTLFCVFFMLIGPFVASDSFTAFMDSLVNQRFGFVKKQYDLVSPKLFGDAPERYDLYVNLDSSFANMVMYHGILAFALFVISLIATLIRALNRNDRGTVAVITGASLSGMIETYLSSLSFKNITYFFIGDYICNVIPKFVDDRICGKYGILPEEGRETLTPAGIESLLFRKIRCIKIRREHFSLRLFHIYKGNVIRYFDGTRWIKCLLPGIVTAIIVFAVTISVYDQPLHMYKVIDAWSEPEGTVYTYTGGDDLEIDESLVVGEKYAGCQVEEITWADLDFETVRAKISAVFWGFIAGFLIAAYIFNSRKLHRVCIEEPIYGDGPYTEMPKCRILGVNVAVTNMQRTVSCLDSNLDKLRGRYICVSNVHTTETAYHDSDYLRIQNNAAIVLPDGKPLSYVCRNRGHLQAERVAGPDLMEEIFRISAEKGYRHFFFGSTQETLDKLRESLEARYPGINIVGMLSPDYYKTVEDIPSEVDHSHIDCINNSKPDFIWVGLGAPKQEKWMSAHEGKVTGVMLGVGAGFDFHAGTIKRAPGWMQALYLEWLFRLLQDPKRLFKRYVGTNFSFIIDAWKEGRRQNRQNAIGLESDPKENKKSKLLIYAHYYTPDVASTGQLLTELAEGLLDKLEVTVIAAVPSYSGFIDTYYQQYKYYYQNIREVKVYRVRVPEFTKTSKFSRVWNICGYFISARAMTRKLGPQDYVYAISQPPILGGRLGVYGAKKKKAKLIYNIQDFNPEQTLSTGYSKNPFVISMMMKADNNSVKHSDLVITVGRDLVDTLVNRCKWDVPPRYAMINNWFDEKAVYPLPKSDPGVHDFLRQYGLDEKFVFMYSGNLGLYYDLNTLIETINRIPSDMHTPDGREIVFAFVGNGNRKQMLEDYVAAHDMRNVVFIPYQDKDKLIFSLNAADVHICTNAKGIKGVSCPSKYYGIAAAGKPVLAVLEEGSEIRCIIEETRGGLVSEPEDKDALYDNMLSMINMASDDCSELPEMGRRSREYLVNNLTKDASIARYEEAILSIQ